MLGVGAADQSQIEGTSTAPAPFNDILFVNEETQFACRGVEALVYVLKCSPVLFPLCYALTVRTSTHKTSIVERGIPDAVQIACIRDLVADFVFPEEATVEAGETPVTSIVRKDSSTKSKPLYRRRWVWRRIVHVTSTSLSSCSLCLDVQTQYAASSCCWFCFGTEGTWASPVLCSPPPALFKAALTDDCLRFPASVPPLDDWNPPVPDVEYVLSTS